MLPPSLASQIAAGEVVERPASVVKEVVENALDADASRCDVEVEAGGIARIVVTDDGSGMSEQDASLAIERHATSKIRVFEDLQGVTSHGFRGEALPSIASISRLWIRTRERGADAGVEVHVEGGEPPTLRPVGMPQGTSVEVRDLFFNVPARRKFLRSTGTEAGHITEVVEALALSRPDVSFTLVRDSRQVRELLRSRSRSERVAQVLVDEPLTRVEGERGPLRMEAFLSRPERSRQGAQGLRFIVNGRSVRDRMLAATVAQAYGSVLERGRYPRGVVYLDIASALVDVNVHPQKAEVRFVDPRAVADALYGVLCQSLTKAFSDPRPPPAQVAPATITDEPSAALETPSESSATPAASETTMPPSHAEVAPQKAVPAAQSKMGGFVAVRRPPENRAERGLPVEAVADSRELSLLLPLRGPTREGEPRSEETPVLSIRDNGTAPIRPRADVKWRSLKFVVQLRRMYLLCEDADGLYVIDQHAAAERVTFDRLRRQFRNASVKSQSLLFPVTFSMQPTEVEFIREHLASITGMGVDVRVRGDAMISIHGVPSLLQRASPERLVRDLVSELNRAGGRGFSDAVDLALATMACHGSLRSGDVVTLDSATALLKALDEADFAGHCPHGRPVVTFISYAELERKVGRR